MRFTRILLVSAAALVAGCNGTHYTYNAGTVAGPTPPPPIVRVYSAGPGVIHDLPGFLHQIQYAIVGEHDTSVSDSRLVHIPLFIEDAAQTSSADPGSALFESRLHQPITAPDGHVITLGEFNAAAGTAKVTCLNHTTTKFELNLTGLIPNGVYTAWLVTFNPAGIDNKLSNLKGLGALGSSDGTQNRFVASDRGEGTLTVTMPEGRLSVLGKLDDCVFEHAFEFHVVCAYHIGGATYGPDLGPAGVAVEQLGFMFRHR
jgi:hypothetical protein